MTKKGIDLDNKPLKRQNSDDKKESIIKNIQLIDPSHKHKHKHSHGHKHGHKHEHKKKKQDIKKVSIVKNDEMKVDSQISDHKKNGDLKDNKKSGIYYIGDIYNISNRDPN